MPPELGVDHFAAYPTEWPRRIIAGWSPPGVCTTCGEGRRPVVARDVPINGRRYLVTDHGSSQPPRRFFDTSEDTQRAITGYACACPTPDAPTKPSTVLDPFVGTGTTVLVADVLGRHGIGVDLSADYCRLAQWRTQDSASRAKAARVEKPPPVIDGQLTLEVL